MKIQSLLNAEEFSNLKRSQYPEKIVISDTVPAGQQIRAVANIGHIGSFLSLYVTGSFTTLALAGADIIDNGVCSLRGLILDGTGTRKMFNDFVPMDLFVTPGRVKHISAVNRVAVSGTVLRADPSQQMFYPTEFQHLFDLNSTIIFDVKNDSDTPNYFTLCFHGIRLIRGGK